MRLLDNLKLYKRRPYVFKKEFITNPNSLDFRIHRSPVIAIYTLCLFHMPRSATKVCSRRHDKRSEEFVKSTTHHVFVRYESLAPNMIRLCGARSRCETCFCYMEKFTATYLNLISWSHTLKCLA